jgi:hypothetical protein
MFVPHEGMSEKGMSLMDVPPTLKQDFDGTSLDPYCGGI